MTTTLSKIILLTLPLSILPLSPLIHHRSYPLISSLTPIQCLFPCQVSEVSLLMPRNEHDTFPPSLSFPSHPHSAFTFCVTHRLFASDDYHDKVFLISVLFVLSGLWQLSLQNHLLIKLATES